MQVEFRGRSVFGGAAEGIARVSRGGFNALAAYATAIVDQTDTALCADKQNLDLFDKDLAGCILCVPHCVGSTTAGPVWEYVAEKGIAPRALLMSTAVDSLTAGGLVLAQVWIRRPVVLVDRLGDEFLDAVRNDCRIRVDADGIVRIAHADRS